MTDTTNPGAPKVDQATGKAADELIAVTGDKTVERLWDLGDSIVGAIPNIHRQPSRVTRRELEAIRRHAIDKAGHEEFWSQQRLKQIGTTAARWKKSDRIPEVSVDAHMEALKADKPKELLEQLAKDKKADPSKKGPVSIREVRDAIGANGGTKATRAPTLGKQTTEQLWGEMVAKRADLKKWLRGELKSQDAMIAAFADMFAELKAKSEQLSATTTAPAAPSAPEAKKATPKKKADDRKKKGRVKGI